MTALILVMLIFDFVQLTQQLPHVIVDFPSQSNRYAFLEVL
jgi:hypothetical protein